MMTQISTVCFIMFVIIVNSIESVALNYAQFSRLIVTENLKQLNYFVYLQLFSILFFFMLFVLGIGSNIAMCSCIITVIRDQFPKLKPWQGSVGLAIVGFTAGLVYVTPVSLFVFHNFSGFV